MLVQIWKSPRSEKQVYIKKWTIKIDKATTSSYSLDNWDLACSHTHAVGSVTAGWRNPEGSTFPRCSACDMEPLGPKACTHMQTCKTNGDGCMQPSKLGHCKQMFESARAPAWYELVIRDQASLWPFKISPYSQLACLCLHDGNSQAVEAITTVLL